jgi:ferredoxin
MGIRPKIFLDIALALPYYRPQTKKENRCVGAWARPEGSFGGGKMAKESAGGKVTFETEKCGGCRSCELACSFHHRGLFQPKIASIEINDRPKNLGFTTTIYRDGSEGHIACDQCKGLPVPMCVQFCPSMLREELADLMKMG